MATVWMALGLSSCAYFTGDSAPQPVVEAPPQPPVAVVPPPVPPRPARKPRPSPLQQPSGQPPAAEDKTIDPEHLIGLDESDAAQWLGEPDQRTNAAPAAIWRYLSRDCQVDVYFYFDLQRGVMRALHFEVTSDYIDDRRSEQCFQQIVGEHRRRDATPNS